jgi:hypothetical protein
MIECTYMMRTILQYTASVFMQQLSASCELRVGHWLHRVRHRGLQKA